MGGHRDAARAATTRLRAALARAIAPASTHDDLTHWRLSAFLETADEVAFETTADGTITYVGARSVELLGYEPADVVGQSMAVVLAPGELARARTLLADSLAAGSGWTKQRYTYVARDGQLKDLYSSALLHLGPDGEPIGFTGTLRAIEQDVAELAALERTRERVAAVLEHQALHPVYQPIVSVTSGEVVGVEALARFSAEPVQAPDRWFRDAASVGLGTELELLAVQKALHGAQHLPAGLYVSVNVSPQTLLSGRLVALLDESLWPTSRLVLEITEHVSVDDYAELLPYVDEVRGRGARVAVDDAGAGYASFRHILRLCPDFIKLDRTLVDGLDHDPAKRALAGAFVTFGREMGATVVAEGIESEQELQAAGALGIQSAQGYHLGRPAPVDQVRGVIPRQTAAPETLQRQGSAAT
ncbi:MAG: EAL domain-containing protein [Angustibacter sp.]